MVLLWETKALALVFLREMILLLEMALATVHVAMGDSIVMGDGMPSIPLPCNITAISSYSSEESEDETSSEEYTSTAKHRRLYNEACIIGCGMCSIMFHILRHAP